MMTQSLSHEDNELWLIRIRFLLKLCESLIGGVKVIRPKIARMHKSQTLKLETK